MLDFIVLLLAIGAGYLRFQLPSHELSLAGSAEAFMHIGVGALLGGFFISWLGAKNFKSYIEETWQELLHHTPVECHNKISTELGWLKRSCIPNYFLAVVAIGLTAVEVIAFFTR